MKIDNFFAELKRRNVYKVAVAYAVVGWLLVQVATQVFPFLEIPNWVIRLVIALVVIGFPVALVIAWAFEATAEGIKRTEVADAKHEHSRGKTWIYVVLIGAAISIALFFVGRYTAGNNASAARTELSAKSIAVLPFENLSDDKGNAYFADGIQDEILARLSKIADLKVISRTSTQKYKSAPDNLRDIAQKLGVTNVLEGSVQKAGEQVRITVQLINASKDEHLWAETYDRTMNNIFGVESDVAEKIATALEAKLTGREKKQLAFEGTKNPAAYDAVLHGIALSNSQSSADIPKMREYFQRAVQLDPNYAQAWAFLGTAQLQLYPAPEEAAKARKAIETAIRLAPDLEDGHIAMGVYKYYAEQDYDGALAQLAIALEQQPNDYSAIYFTGLVQRRQGKFDDAISAMQQAASLDPLNQDILVNLATTYRGMRRFDEARGMFDRALTVAPNDPNILANKAETYIAQGDLDKAWEILAKLQLSPADSGFGVYMRALFLRRQFDEMLARTQPILAEEKDLPLGVRQVIPAATALVYLTKGDRAAALPLIEQARRDRLEWRKQRTSLPVLYFFNIAMEARLNNRAEVEQEIKELFDKTRNDKWEFPNSETTAAIGYVLLGDLDHALPLVEDALSRPSANSLTSSDLKLDPNWDAARDDRRFQKLLDEHK